MSRHLYCFLQAFLFWVKMNDLSHTVSVLCNNKDRRSRKKNLLGKKLGFVKQTVTNPPD